MAVKPIPDGYHTVTPHLIVRDGARALDFYKHALGAEELFRMADPSGKIGHSEIKIGNSILMLADEMPDMGYKSPQSYGGTPISIMLYVEDVDSRFQKAVAAGAKVKRPLKDQFYGDRSGTIEDPFGHEWTIATHKEDLSAEEIGKRAAEAMKQSA